MNRLIYILFFIGLLSCNTGNSQNNNYKVISQNQLTNLKVKDHAFLDCMYQDPYFPDFLVDRCKNVLLNLCNEIEKQKPENLDGLYLLTHWSTNEINNLQEDFFEHNSEIETVARECLAIDFEYIAKAYGYDADIEALIATREW